MNQNADKINKKLLWTMMNINKGEFFIGMLWFSDICDKIYSTSTDYAIKMMDVSANFEKFRMIEGEKDKTAAAVKHLRKFVCHLK